MAKYLMMKNIQKLSFIILLVLVSCKPQPTKEEAMNHFFHIMDEFRPITEDIKSCNAKLLSVTLNTFENESGIANATDIKNMNQELEAILYKINRAKRNIENIEKFKSKTRLKQKTVIYLIEVYELYDKPIRLTIEMMKNGVNNYSQNQIDENFAKLEKIQKKGLIHVENQKQFFEEFKFNESDFKLIEKRYLQ